MPPNRGTDLSTEQRRIRPREENDRLGKWLEALFDAAAEVLVFTIPVLSLVFLTGDLELSFVTVAGLAAFVLGVGLQRHRPLGPSWPRMTPLLVLVRLVLYNVALVAGLALGGLLFTEPVVDFAWAVRPILAPSLVTAAVALVVAAVLPYLAVALGHTPNR
jgi:ribose/xylose/arabinose/galactoside ABC-type transport system permease subunit